MTVVIAMFCFSIGLQLFHFSRADICQQVQDIEFMQIEMKVIEGLKIGNDCLKSMHEVFTLFFSPSYPLCLEICLSHSHIEACFS